MSSYRHLIENTTAFKNLELFKQKIYSTGGNMKILGEQYVQAKNIGFDVWLLTRKPNNVEREIIKELLSC